MNKVSAIFLAGFVLGMSVSAMASPPELHDPRTGKYLGNLSNNQWDRNSTSNPWGRYGSQYSPDSINNPYGRYGSRYSSDSPNNPQARGRTGPDPMPAYPMPGYQP